MPISDLFAVFRWWLVLLLLGAAATPLAHVVLKRLPDRGYAFTKMLGLLVVSYLFWLLGTLGMLENSLGSVLLALGLLVVISYAAYRRGKGDLATWWRDNWRYVLITEALFLFMFVLWSWIRAQNPAITATEKPMELAFLNSVGRSPSYPPLDPWLSGFAISYYYFGYVMTSVLARLAAVPEAIAFNLGIAWLAAGAALGAFGAVYNLISAGRRERLYGGAVALGLVAAVALPMAGNLEVALEALHGNGIGSGEFWAWLDVRDINQPPDPETAPRYDSTSWWWWRSSRVIHEYRLSGQAEEGLEPIAEFPAFSFVLGDMHPHVLALPFAFLSLAVALAWWLTPWVSDEEDPPLSVQDHLWRDLALTNRFRLLANQIGWPLLGLTALLLGGLSFLNTWDVLIHLFVVLAAFVLAQWRAFGMWRARLLEQGLMVAVLLAIPAILLYLPFYLGFRSQAGAPFLLPTLVYPTRLVHFAVIFGMSLWSILIFLGALIMRSRRRRWRVALLSSAALLLSLLLLMLFLGWIVAASAQGAGTVTQVAGDLGLLLPERPALGSLAAQALWGLQAIASLAPAILSTKVSSSALVLLLLALAGIIAMLWTEFVPSSTDRDPQPGPKNSVNEAEPEPHSAAALTFRALPFVLLLVFTGVLLSLGPEFVYLKDNFGQRLNTIFKFYYQTWVLFGIAALYALYYLWHRARAVSWIAIAGYGLLLLVALSFPYLAVNSRAAEYGESATLDGLAQLARYNPEEFAAIQWLRENAGASDVIVEAVGGQYSGYGRVSAHTGLPTLLGWAGHEYQWRGDTPEPGEREPAVREIYGDSDWARTTELLNRYGVDFVYVGGLEQNSYGSQVWDKFDGLLETAYATDNVIIYRWFPE